MLTSGNLYFTVLFCSLTLTGLWFVTVLCCLLYMSRSLALVLQQQWFTVQMFLSLSSVHLLTGAVHPQLLKLLVFTSACLKWLPRATQADFQRNLTTRQGPLYTDIYPCVFFASRYHGRQIMSFTWARIPTKDQNIQVSFSELVSLLELFTGAHTSTQDCIQHPWGFQVSLEQLYWRLSFWQLYFSV